MILLAAENIIVISRTLTNAVLTSKAVSDKGENEGEQTVDSTTILFIERPSKSHQHLQRTNHFRQEMFSEGLYKVISKEH